jgi:hypothetical protein
VILVGEQGSGKSSIPRALADQIAEGKWCDSIRDPQIFACGASKFKSTHSSWDSLTFDSLTEKFENFERSSHLFLR